MSAPSTSGPAPGPAVAAGPRKPIVSPAGLRLAAIGVLRAGALIALALCFFALWFFHPTAGRSILVGVPIVVLLLITGLRRDVFTWAIYIVGFLVFVDLRAISAEALFPARFGYVIAAEKALFAGAIPTVWLQHRLYTLGAPGMLEYALIGIHFSFFLVPHVLAIVLWKVDRRLFRRYVLALVATCYVGLIVAFLVPTAPPWLAGAEGRIEPVYRIMRDVMMGLTPDNYSAAYRGVGENAVAAMPSLHTALTLLVALGLASAAPRLRPLGWAYLGIMMFALVYLGEHYVVDIVAGLATGWACWWLVGRLAPSSNGGLPERRGSQ